MLELVVGVAIGLVIGWNFLPQPQWAKNIVSKLTGK